MNVPHDGVGENTEFNIPFKGHDTVALSGAYPVAHVTAILEVPTRV